MTQRDGVYMAVVSVFGTLDSSVAVELDKSQKEQVYAQLMHSFQNGDIEYRGGCPSPEKLAKYIPGLVNNWLRKDKRLNGGGEYIPKNPGSRTGAGDETLKAMKVLLANTTDTDVQALIEEEIAIRKQQLAPKVELNVAALPEHLQKYVPPTIRRKE